MKKFRYLDEIAPADCAFEAWGDSLEELFVASADAVLNVLIDPGHVRPEIRRDISLTAEHIDDLLFSFLSELIFLKDVENMVFCRCDLVVEKNGKYRLDGDLWGQDLDPIRSCFKVDIKAVTYHKFQVARVGDKWKATVVLDL